METVTQLVVWGGFVLAFVMGYVANKTSFCTMGAVSDWMNIGDTGRMRAWEFAMAVALLGEPFAWYHAAGFLLVLTGIVLAERWRARQS